MGSRNKNKKSKTRREFGSTSDGAHDGGNHRNNGKSGGKVITDTRFSSLHSDPRFRDAPKHKAKVAIDSRFNRMFTDRNFAASKASIDKRGKLKKKESAIDSLKHYYRLEEDEEEKSQANEAKRSEELLESEESKESEGKKLQDEDVESEEESESNSESESDAEGTEKSNKHSLKLKNESEISESEEEEGNDDSDTSSTDSDEEDEVYEEEEETLVQEENIPEIDKETHRLAVVNMDWSQVKAVDLYVLLSSFLPKGGQIVSVAVYPSEFGLKRMEEEAIHGPVGLYDDDKKKTYEDEDEDEDDDDEIDNEKLRAYELSRLRYYYAVVECDSTATADYLYKICDGVEFERSSTKLDLRFIPDSVELKHHPRDVATKAPADYEGLDFHTRALQHSNIHLTWDDDEPQRAKTLKRKFNAEQLAELELKEFMASDESESDDSENADGGEDRSAKKHKKQDLYRALIQSGDGSDENGDEDEDQDMEVTFNTGLEDLSKRILEKKDKTAESVWEAYLRKKREKKKAKKNKSKNSSGDESSDTGEEPAEEPDDFFVEDSSVKGSKGTRARNAKKEKLNEETYKEAEASRGELELLLADDKGTDSSLKGYNLKRKKQKGKKGKEIPDEGKLPSVDYDDPRFSALFSSPLFALDPTDPHFKRSAAYARQMSNRQPKGGGENIGVKEQSELAGQGPVYSRTERDHTDDLHPDVLISKKEKHELSSLVRSIKMKSKQITRHGNTPSRNDKLKSKVKESR